MQRFPVACLLLLCLPGCRSTDTVYHHGDHSTVVYHYLKNEDTSGSEQIERLENLIAQAETKGKPVPPGLHAHLGMLYFESGNPDVGMTHLLLEKEYFPESATYIDFLISNFQKGGG